MIHLHAALAVLAVAGGVSEEAPAAPVRARQAPLEAPAEVPAEAVQSRRPSLADFAPGPIDPSALIEALRHGHPAGGARSAGGAGSAGAVGPATASGVTGVKALPLGVRGHAARWYVVTVVTSGGCLESFIVFRPTPLPASPKPLLVAFHGYAVSPLDIAFNTTFIQEASARGWYLVAPLGCNQVHFSFLPSQESTEEVLEWMLQHFDVDDQRIYGVGFSMGGGAATNYAARHLDPAKPMFAAVVSHTGTVALRYNLWADPFGHSTLFDFLFGTGVTGSADPWKMNRSSLIDIDPTTGLVDPTQDLARNLIHTPLRLFRVSNDPLAWLTYESDVLHTHLHSLGKPAGISFENLIVPGTDHKWSTMDEKDTCDWLSQFSLTLPSSGNTLVDHDGAFYDFDVTQDAPGAFTAFQWSLDVGNNALDANAEANLAELRLRTIQAGLDPSQPLTAVLSTQDANGDAFTFEDYVSAPSSVLRGGAPAAPGSWSHAGGALTIIETSGSAQTWMIIP